jgi:hypothetical protein
VQVVTVTLTVLHDARLAWRWQASLVAARHSRAMNAPTMQNMVDSFIGKPP